MGIFFVLCDNFIIFVSVSRAKHKLEDFGEMSGKRCVSFVQWIEGWRCESLKKVSLMPRGSSTGETECVKMWRVILV